jgi:phosphoglycolate phosphatase-like HAD superfamily hydrolase
VTVAPYAPRPSNGVLVILFDIDGTLITTGGASIARAGAVLGTPVDPHQAWVVGDTTLDIAAAHGAGTVAIGVASGIYSTDELHDAGADHVLPALTDELPL